MLCCYNLPWSSRFKHLSFNEWGMGGLTHCVWTPGVHRWLSGQSQWCPYADLLPVWLTFFSYLGLSYHIPWLHSPLSLPMSVPFCCDLFYPHMYKKRKKEKEVHYSHWSIVKFLGVSPPKKDESFSACIHRWNVVAGEVQGQLSHTCATKLQAEAQTTDIHPRGLQS